MVLVLMTFFAAIVNPTSDCSWMNSATASGILGGASTLATKPNVCEWTRVDASKPSLLRIEIVALKSVSDDYPNLRARCTGPTITLKTLGNEAIACGDSQSQIIVGRVRDQGFVITLSGIGGPLATTGIRRAADQVAGNLF